MKKTLLLLMFLSASLAFSQSKSFWQKESPASSSRVKPGKQDLPLKQTYSLNFNAMKAALRNAPMRGEFSGSSNLIVAFPNHEGVLEHYRIIEAPVMHADLMAKYPEIKSYAGQGVEDPSATIRFSVSPLGLQSMQLSSNSEASFIEPYTKDKSQYTIYKRSDRTSDFDSFECEVTAAASKKISGNSNLRNADDSILRTYRLAVSATGEYTSYHGGTKALALAAMNTTMTRVNGIYESDFNVTMVLIANTDDVIYTNSGSDPYSTTSSYNNQLQSTLTSVIGEANYDVGHLFANLQNNGNAGCIGCVCVNGQKGSGWTSHTTPEGDNFDVDYVAHELGHQFGGNHTFTHGNEGTGVQMEPGSGSTIMGYAGITGSTDVQAHSDPYFHAATIEQITDYIKSTSCQTNTPTGNAVPTVSAGSNYTIPRGTPFVLDGTASDTDTGDVLTYGWEQMNSGSPSTTNPSVNATSGPAFRSFNPTTDSKRYFPRLETVKTGATSWQWEAVPNVARSLNFRLTVRDNVAGGGTNKSDDMIVTVNGTAGPFVLNSPNTNVTWNAGTTQTVTWDVAGTTGNGVNAANVDIYLSTDGGDTYTVALASGVPNDGSHDILVPNNQGSQNRIMVKGFNNIFFDISNTNFTIAGQVVCNATTPTGLGASGISSNAATLSWDAVAGASFDLEYRQVGAGSWTTVSVNGISQALSGLSSLTQYEAQVRSKCPDTSTSAYSNIVSFTTTDVQLNYCTSASTNVNDEYISRVQLNTIDNASGAQFYSDFTGVSTTLTKDSQYTITVTPTWTGTVYSEGYSVWIDYNRDGDFADAGEQVFSQAATKNTPVSGNFTVPASAVENATTMRVSMKYNGVPTSCEAFTYGEVEDYSIVIKSSTPDTTAPVITLNGASTINLDLGDTYTELGATATDDVDGDLTSSIVIGGDAVDTNTAGTYLVTYNVSDAAGNAATEVTRTVIVAPDTTAPVISLIGSATINLTIGDNYTEQGATATDNVDGDLTSSIVIGGDAVDTNTAGTYVVTYNVSDAAGNAATQVTRTVIVAPDTIAPIITLIGVSTINLNIGGIYTEQGATATDNVDGDLTSSVVIGGDVVDTNTAGTYTITYNVSDSAGNAATQVTRTVIVAADTIAPVITLNGAASMSLELGSSYTEQGATATDNVDGDLTSSIVIAGDIVNTNLAGTYIITYNVSDASGNAAIQVVRNVTVNPDTTVPVITLNGASTINLLVGDTYTEQGATASDNYDGDITSSIVIAGATVDTNTAGTYVVTYNVSDTSGNAAAQVIRTVNVTEPTNGCSGGISTFPYNEGFENTLGGWTQSAADDIDWTVDASGTPSSNTGPSSASEGSYYIYVEASSPNYPSKRAILNSPCFDLSGMIGATFSFMYHQYGSTDMGTIDLEISDDDGSTWTSIWNQSGNQGNQWLAVNVNLDAYVGGGVQLRFNRNIGGTWQADIAIDDVSLTGPDTTAPTAATLSASNTTDSTTDLSWSGATDNVGVTNYDVYQDGAFVANVSGTTYDVTGLSSNTSYNFHVIAKDAAGNSSVASNTVNVNTLAAPTCDDGIQNGDETGVDCGGSSCAPCAVTDVTLHEGYFESGWDGWIDGGSDAARYSGSRSYEGSYSIRLRDNTSTSTMTLSNIDVTPYSQIEVDFHFYVYSMENNEDFWLQYYNGSSYTTVASWVSGTDINNNTFYNATITLTPAQYNFVANAGFRFRCDASGNADQIYIDQVIITGTNSSRGEVNSLVEVGTGSESRNGFEEDFMMYPNPAKDILNIKLAEGKQFSYVIRNMLGQTVLKGQSDGQIRVASIKSGMYFVDINDGEETMTRKFVRE